MRVLDALQKAIRDAAIYNPEIQVAPFCILWPDKDRQWEASLPLLRDALPELLTLGNYDVSKREGPAIWLRCAVSGFDLQTPLVDGHVPILYLPGVSRQELRAVESCPDHLKAIAELQYRGVFWSQLNARDWTLFAFLVSAQGGVGLDIAQDNETKNALMLAMTRLLDEEVESLHGRRLEKDFFNELVSGKDVPKDILLWLDDAERFRLSRDENAWKAFIEICISQFAFNPEKAGPIEAARLLANHQGPWITVWDRYREAASRYPSIPDQIRKAQPPAFDLFTDIEAADGWPQWNESEEKDLLSQLSMKCAGQSPHVARSGVLKLEEKHGARRGLVWAELGDAPLALILKHLSRLATLTEQELPSATLKDLEEAYRITGWKADAAMLAAFAVPVSDEMHTVISSVVQAIYAPWLVNAATKLQTLVRKSGYPGDRGKQLEFKYSDGTCLVFVDGLRYDTAKRLKELLEREGLDTEEHPFWTTLPSNTISGKAAVSPVASMLDGSGDPKEFVPGVVGTGYSLKGGYHLRKLLLDSGWQILEKQATGDVKGRAWCEVGNLDHEGHDRGWRLALHIEPLLKEIQGRVMALSEAGWSTIRIVTDHGWILLPGGLPKADLPSYLTETQSGRCASIKSGAESGQMVYPWYWDTAWDVALAPGISCYRAGEEYQHGGLSLQECLTLQMIVKSGTPSTDVFKGTLNLTWRGLRCNVASDGDFFGLFVDIRLEPGLASTSVVLETKPFRDDGITSVVVEDEDLDGRAASLLLLDANNTVVYQMDTIIGG
jgi:hypothetical protein